MRKGTLNKGKKASYTYREVRDRTFKIFKYEAGKRGIQKTYTVEIVGADFGEVWATCSCVGNARWGKRCKHIKWVEALISNWCREAQEAGRW